MKSVRLGVMGVLLGAALTSCGELVVVAAMQFDLTVTPAQLTVRQGAQGQLTVKVKRLLPGGMSPVPVTVALAGPPAGVTAEPVTVGSGQSEATLTLRIASGAAPGGPMDLVVQGRAGVVTKTGTTALTITP